MKLTIQPAAREDILRQFRYYLIERDSERTAEKLLVSVQETMRQIHLHPGIGAPRPLPHPALKGLRAASVRGFPALRVYYINSESTLRVIRVLHSKRDVASILDSES